MNKIAYTDYLSHLPDLTYHQKQKLKRALELDSINQSLSLIESAFLEKEVCPHCNCKHIARWGKSNGLQRYRCKDCHKTFNALTKTNFARLRHRDKWLEYSQSVIEGDTVRQAARKCEINATTAFRWRHRFLKQHTLNKPEQMLGITEADEVFFAESSKGNKALSRKPRKRGKAKRRARDERIPVLMVRDRTGNVAEFVLSTVEKEEIVPCLQPLMNNDVVLCTDGNLIYHEFAKAENIAHKRLVGTSNIRVIDNIFHIQNLNAYVSRLRQWLNRFRGVSTKYLHHYLGWRRMIEGARDDLREDSCLQMALARNFTNS